MRRAYWIALVMAGVLMFAGCNGHEMEVVVNVTITFPHGAKLQLPNCTAKEGEEVIHTLLTGERVALKFQSFDEDDDTVTLVLTCVDRTTVTKTFRVAVGQTLTIGCEDRTTAAIEILEIK